MKENLEILRRPLTAILFLTCLLNTVFAQQEYYSRSGTITMLMKYRDTLLVARSNHLNVRINYESGELNFSVAYSTFYTGNDSIDHALLNLQGQGMEFKGKLSSRYINTRKHPPQKLKLEGMMLSAFPPAQINATGTLYHLSNEGSAACELTLRINSTLSALNLQDVFKNAEDSIQIDIQQVILKRSGD